MELLLLKLVALLRPFLSMQYTEGVAQVIGVGLFGIMVGAMLVSIALRKSLALSAIDLLILAFTAWCVATYLIYFDPARTGELAKLLLPMLTYMLVKNVILSHNEYSRLIYWIIVGFSVPTLVSAALIASASPSAIDMVSYWTGIIRWQGAYTHSHNLGHSMTLFLITLVVYVTVRGIGDDERYQTPWTIENIILVLLGAIALYCLYMSEVRSAILGLLLFVSLYVYSQSKKVFLISATAFTVVAVVAAPYWIPVLLHEFDPNRRGGELEIMQMGSGRLNFWLNDITVFARLPIDQQLAGVGIGTDNTSAGRLYGHNDWLRILTDTGLVGLVLFTSIQIFVLRAIFRMDKMHRYAFLALFVAVNVMMAVSNSYTLRIQVSQLYYMILAFIEIPHNRAQTKRIAERAAVNSA